MARFESPC